MIRYFIRLARRLWGTPKGVCWNRRYPIALSERWVARVRGKYVTVFVGGIALGVEPLVRFDYDHLRDKTRSLPKGWINLWIEGVEFIQKIEV